MFKLDYLPYVLRICADGKIKPKTLNLRKIMKTQNNVTVQYQYGNSSKPLLMAKLFLIRVKANHKCWISDIEGDPGRTLLKENAQVFEDKRTADLVCYSLTQKYPNRKFLVERF